jgi:colicin import membrane protein
MSAAVLARPEPPGQWLSLLLAISMHLLLAGFLFFGIRWQITVPAAVTVDLVAAPPDTAVSPAPTPAPEVEPEPPPPKPVVREEPPPPPKPDIAVKEKPKKPEPKKPEPKKPEPKPAPPKVDPMKERLARESRELEQRKRVDAMNRDLANAREQARSQVAAGQASAREAWAAKIRAKVRGNIVLPPDVRGNLEAAFEISLLPGGDVLTVRLAKSSGFAALDNAIERAILKSSPLPKPEQPEVFERNLHFVVRPLEN